MSVAIAHLLSSPNSFYEEDVSFFRTTPREINVVVLTYLLDKDLADRFDGATQNQFYAQVVRVFRVSQWVGAIVWDGERQVSDREKVLDLKNRLEKTAKDLEVPRERLVLTPSLDLEPNAKAIVLFYSEEKIRRDRGPAREHERIDLQMDAIDKETQVRLRAEIKSRVGEKKSIAKFLGKLQDHTDYMVSPERIDQIQREYAHQQLIRAANLSFPAFLWDIKEFGMFVSVITLGPMYYFAFSATAIGLTALALVASAFAVHRLIRWAYFP